MVLINCALGYLSCALEILSQTFEMGINIDKIVVTSGSGGTHSGLLAGMVSANANIPIIGIGVNKRKDEQRKIVWTKANEVAKTVGSINEVKYEDVIVFDDYMAKDILYLRRYDRSCSDVSSRRSNTS